MGSQPKDTLGPDAWDRFERAVDVVAKSPPQHRPPKVTEKPKKAAKKAARRKAK